MTAASEKSVYPITLGTYGQTIGEVSEKMIGPAILFFPIFGSIQSISKQGSVGLSLAASFLLFGIATAVTQLTLIYSKSKREDNALDQEDTAIIRFLTKYPTFVVVMTNLGALAEGLTAVAALYRFGLKAELSSLGKELGEGLDTFLIILVAVFACYSRYKKINYVDSQEARNEFEMREVALHDPLAKFIEEANFPFKKRMRMWDPKLTNYLSYQVSPNLENILNVLGPYMFYNDVSEFLPESTHRFLFAFSIMVMMIGCYGEYCAQLQDSRWYRQNAYRSYEKNEVDTWTHYPYWLGKIILQIATLPGRFAKFIPDSDPTTWIYNGMKVSKIAGYTTLIGSAGIELYKVLYGETASPTMAFGIPVALLGMTVGFFAGRGQCQARDTGLRNIAAYLASRIGTNATTLQVPHPEGRYEWPGLWTNSESKTKGKDLTVIADRASEYYHLHNSIKLL